MGNTFNQFSKLVQTQNECNFDKEEHMFEETDLRELCKEVIVEGLPTRLKLIGPVSHASLELVPSPFTCSPSSLSLKHSLVKLMDDYVKLTQ